VTRVSGIALGLVLTAAVVHAVWNLLAKQVPSGVPFVWLCAVTSAVWWFPVAVVAAWTGGVRLGLVGAGLIVGSSLIHIGYFLALQHGYRLGELSVTYPLARGSAPLMSTFGAVAVLGERPTGVGGSLLLGGGVVVLSYNGSSLDAHARAQARRAAAVGIGVGGIIAVYTVWDAYAIKVVALSPVLYNWAEELVRASVLAVPATRRWDATHAVWARHRGKILAVGALSPLSYTLVLVALQTSDVSQVAPLRESSVLIGVLLGARLLGEGRAVSRLLAAAAIFTGILALAWS
jgi:drug/metabolite transporter (DMT)-like permease